MGRHRSRSGDRGVRNENMKKLLDIVTYFFKSMMSPDPYVGRCGSDLVKVSRKYLRFYALEAVITS
mgnify:CR=1 FL=1